MIVRLDDIKDGELSRYVTDFVDADFEKDERVSTEWGMGIVVNAEYLKYGDSRLCFSGRYGVKLDKYIAFTNNVAYFYAKEIERVIING